MSSWRWSAAPLPMRTGFWPLWPSRCVSSSSGISLVPWMVYLRTTEQDEDDEDDVGEEREEGEETSRRQRVKAAQDRREGSPATTAGPLPPAGPARDHEKDDAHDLETLALAPRAQQPAEPVDVLVRLLGEAEAQEGVDRERRVADPRVAVVPVPAGAVEVLGDLREENRRGGRGGEGGRGGGKRRGQGGQPRRLSPQFCHAGSKERERDAR